MATNQVSIAITTAAKSTVHADKIVHQKNKKNSVYFKNTKNIDRFPQDTVSIRLNTFHHRNKCMCT